MFSPGSHVVFVTKTPDDLHGRSRELEFRDTILIACPGTVLFALVFRVPIQESTVAAQVLKTGTGAIWIEGCRVGFESVSTHSRGKNTAFPKRPTETSVEQSGRVQRQDLIKTISRTGRWPPNLLLIHHGSCVQEGVRQVKTGTAHGANASAGNVYGGGKGLISQAKGKDLATRVV